MLSVHSSNSFYMRFVSWNGEIIPEDQVHISPANRSFRYGDGCFETIKVVSGSVLLHDLHYTRLCSSLETLQFKIPPFLTLGYFNSQILEVVKANNQQQLARVRLTVYREGETLDGASNHPAFIIQTSVLEKEVNLFNSSGLTIDFYPDAKKTFDGFSAIKSNNYLPYLMGRMWAKKHDLDDCIIVNGQGRVAETTIANMFIVTNGVIKTPAIEEGCIDGVMRKYLLQCFRKDSLPHFEVAIEPSEVLNASEVFLTNAITGIRWISRVGNSSFTNTLSAHLYHRYISPLIS